QVDEDTEAILDPIAVRDAVQRSNTGDRYQELDDNEATCVWPESAGGRVALTIGGVRRSGLPWLEDAGNVLPLSIGDRQGLVEQTHMVFFDDGIIGAEFNFYGPRPKRLIGFLREKCPDVPPFQLDMLLNFDAAEQVKNLEDIRLIQLRVN